MSLDINVFLAGDNTQAEIAASWVEIDEVGIGIVLASFELLQLD